MPNDELHRQEMCDIGWRMYERGLVAGCDGNLSVRLPSGDVLCTPTGLCKGKITPEDLCVVNTQGEQVAGQLRRSSEILLHLEILQARPDVQAVVHSHPPHATAFALAEKPVPRAITPEAEYFLGEIPIAPYETPGTLAFAQTVLPYVERTNVCLLAHHGSVSYAENLEEAYNLTEMLDAYCRQLILGQQLGPLQPIPLEKIRELEELRIRHGRSFPKPIEKEN